MKKKHIILSILIFISLATFGQNTKSIEVIVSDTIQVEGNEFTYMLIVINDIYQNNINDLGNNLKTINHKELTELVKKEKIDIIQDNNVLPQISPQDIQEHIINLKFYSKDSMMNFLDKLKKYQNIQGFLTNVGIGDKTKEQEELLDKKLIEKGRAKAKVLASYIDKETGEILEISEDVPNHSNIGMNTHDLNSEIGWTSYLSSYNAINQMGLQGSSTYIIFTKSIKMKFELK